MAYSSIYWPADLPQQFLIDGFDEKPAVFMVRTDMDTAMAKQRPRFSSGAEVFSGVLLMTNAQYESFKNFFRSTLKMGSLEFNMQKRGYPDIIQVVRFTPDGYVPNPRGLLWDVKLNLELLP